MSLFFYFIIICTNTVMKLNTNGLIIKHMITTTLKIFKFNFKYEFFKNWNHKIRYCYFVSVNFFVHLYILFTSFITVFKYKRRPNEIYEFVILKKIYSVRKKNFKCWTISTLFFSNFYYIFNFLLHFSQIISLTISLLFNLIFLTNYTKTLTNSIILSYTFAKFNWNQEFLDFIYCFPRHLLLIFFFYKYKLFLRLGVDKKSNFLDPIHFCFDPIHLKSILLKNKSI